MHRGRRAQGDSALAARMDTLLAGRSGMVAAAVVHLDGVPITRCASRGADPARLFEIGSVTKGLTGMLLAIAIERGEISLSTQISDLIPTSIGSEFGGITMKELCTHTSGLPRVANARRSVLLRLGFAFFGLNPYRSFPPPDVLRHATREHLSHVGERRYSNLGGAVLGQLLALAAGVGYAALLRDRILLPIGMTSTAVAAEGYAAPPGRSATGRRRQPWIMDGYAPAGGVVSTIDDMARLAVALLRRSAPGVASIDTIDGVRTDRPNRHSGMFWVVDSGPGDARAIVGHSGRTGGYSSLFVLLPLRRRAVIVLENVSRGAQQHQALAIDLLASLSDRTDPEGRSP